MQSLNDYCCDRLTRPQSSSYNFIQRTARAEVGAQGEIGRFTRTPSHHPLLTLHVTKIPRDNYESLNET